jgi:hypothetical protein
MVFIGGLAGTVWWLYGTHSVWCVLLPHSGGQSCRRGVVLTWATCLLSGVYRISGVVGTDLECMDLK